MRALVVHRDPQAASALVDALAASNGTPGIPARSLLDPGALPGTLARGEADAVVCALSPQDGELEQIRRTCETAGVALVLTDPDAGPVAARSQGCAAHEPDPGRLRAALAREHACARDRYAAATAQRLLSAQQALADHLAADLPPDGLLREALGVLGALFGAEHGVAWELPPDRAELLPRAVHGATELPVRIRFGESEGEAPVDAAPDAGDHLAVRAVLAKATVADGPHVAVPLVAGGACEGVLELRLAPGARPDERLMADVAALASQVALHLRYRRGAAMLDLHERALAATNNGIVIADHDAETGGWPISYANEAFELLTGYRAEEIAGSSLSVLQGEETDPEPVAEMAAALRAGEECWVTLLNYRRDGSPFWNEVFLTPVADADGVVRRYIGVLHDVTARVTSAVELEEAEARYRTLIETIPAVTYIADWDELGSFRYVSPQIEELLGHPPAHWLGDTGIWEEHIHPDDRARVLAETRYAFRQQKAFDCEYRMVAADGRVVWVWERDTVIRDDNGKPYLTQGIITDVTATRIAEAALAESEERNRGVVHALEEGLLIYGADGRVLSCNAAAVRILGLPEDELLYRTADEWPLRILQEDGTPLQRGEMPSQRALSHGLPQRDVVLQDRAPGRRRGVGVGLQPPARARGRVAAVRRRDRLQRHHRAPPRAGADRVPRLPRSADEAAEPRAAGRAPRLGLGARAPLGRVGRAAVRRPRRLQGRQRLARPRRRRRAAAADRGAPARRRALDRPARAPGRRRVPDPA